MEYRSFGCVRKPTVHRYNGDLPKRRRWVGGVLIKELRVMFSTFSDEIKWRCDELLFPSFPARSRISAKSSLEEYLEDYLHLPPSFYSIVGELSPSNLVSETGKVYPFVVLLKKDPKPDVRIFKSWCFISLKRLRPLIYSEVVETEYGLVWGASAEIIRKLFKEAKGFLPEITSVLPI